MEPENLHCNELPRDCLYTELSENLWLNSGRSLREKTILGIQPGGTFFSYAYTKIGQSSMVGLRASARPLIQGQVFLSA